MHFDYPVQLHSHFLVPPGNCRSIECSLRVLKRGADTRNTAGNTLPPLDHRHKNFHGMWTRLNGPGEGVRTKVETSSFCSLLDLSSGGLLRSNFTLQLNSMEDGLPRDT